MQPLPLSAYGEQYLSKLITPENEDTNKILIDKHPVWLEGPAAYWYIKHEDLIKDGKFNYGFKKKTVLSWLCRCLKFVIEEVH